MTIVSDKTTRKFIYEYLKALNCPRSLTVWLLYERGEHKALSELVWDPHAYNDSGDARDSLAASKFLSKAKFLKTGNDLKEIALSKFLESERKCRETNVYLRSKLIKPKTSAALLSASYKISKILGDFDPHEFIDSCGFGPGATTSIKKVLATAPRKFQFETGITEGAYDFVKDWFNVAYPLWEPQFRTISGSKIVTVPKDAKNDRVIAIEPGLNLWFQKGIGATIRKRLKRTGVDLNTQDHNAERSRIASKFNHLATVDFSAASDTISYQLVMELLPRDWFLVLKAFRSSFANVKKEEIMLEKFSSMGNGFTFELESLIFYVLAVISCENVGVSGSVSVFGDDVILPTEAFEDYAEIVEDVGFTINKTKSYSTSYYRESCGAHYWDGMDIKPIFQKEAIDGKDEILKAANAVRRLAHRRQYTGCDSRLRRCWVFLSALLGKTFPRISEGYGEAGLVVNYAETRDIQPAKHGYEGYLVRALVHRPATTYVDHRGLLLAKLKSLGNSTYIGALNPLDITELGSVGNQVPMPLRTKQSLKRLLVPRWYDLGPWN